MEGGGVFFGCSAEAVAPNWFDKSPNMSNDESIAQLWHSLRIAAAAYVQLPYDTPFGMFALRYDVRYDEQIRECQAVGIPPLAAGYGQALLDRAIFDACCKGVGASFSDAIRKNLPGLTAVLTPDLAGFDLDTFLAGLHPLAEVAAQHTIGLLDPLVDADIAPEDRVRDALPQSLHECMRAYGMRHFKIGVGGDVETDAERLVEVARCLDGIDGDYLVTLDGNEQYNCEDEVLALLDRLAGLRLPATDRLRAATACFEQPVSRAISLQVAVHRTAARLPLIIDESDGTLDAFLRHRPLGYAGISSKICKGFYREILNAARCRKLNDEQDGRFYFRSGEDLACQAGLAVQQDLALVSTLGKANAERKAHPYLHGMSAATRPEQLECRKQLPDLYEDHDGVVCLRIRNGRLSTSDIHGSTGWESDAEPFWETLDHTLSFGV